MHKCVIRLFYATVLSMQLVSVEQYTHFTSVIGVLFYIITNVK